MSDSLSNMPSDRTSADDSDGSEELLKERDQPWYELWPEPEHFYSFYEARINQRLPSVKHNTYLAENSVAKTFDEVIKRDPTQEHFWDFFTLKRLEWRKTDALRQVQNDLLSHCSSLSQEQRDEEQQEVQLEEIVQSNAPSPEDTFLQQEVLLEVVQFINESLSERERFCLKRHIQGYSSKEIALELGITPDSVNTAKAQAREKLRKHFKK